ncbi:hypothetical protein ACJ2A9_16710 [Anaerobacillus sp. MEB173]
MVKKEKGSEVYNKLDQYKVYSGDARSSGIEATYEYTSGNKTVNIKNK